MNKKLVVGLTGGIASGKTHASDYLKQLGAYVIDTDIIAREVVAKGSPTLSIIADTFGKDYITDEGALNRQKIRDLVFNDNDTLVRYERIILPAIRKKTLSCLELAPKIAPYILLVVPLLFEKGMNDYCDLTVTIDVKEDMQIKRAIARSAISEQALKGILSKQLSRAERNHRADYVVFNHGDLFEFEKHLADLHQIILDKYKS